MSLLNGLKSLFARKPAVPEMTLETYADLPIFQMLQGLTPFDQWRAPDADIPAGLEDDFKIYVWMYQLYTFYIFTSKRFGSDTAERVVQFQVKRLSRVSDELAKQFQNGIKQIHSNLSCQTQKGFKVRVEDKDIDMPLEYSLALEFLTIGSDSLFRVDKEKLKEGELPDTGNAEFALAECLEHGKNTALAFFDHMAEASKVAL